MIGGVFLSKKIYDTKDKPDLTFGQLLHDMVKESPMTNRQFYELLGIKRAYFYEIIGGRTNPPPADKQFEIIKILKLDDDMCRQFFELAAKERNEFPADLQLLINDDLKNNLRKSQGYRDLLEKKRQG